VVVSHQCLGDAEWPGAFDLVGEQTEIYGLRLEIAKYRNKEGLELPLLEYVRHRGKWPDSSARYCTSEYKRGPGLRVISALFRESPGPVLNVLGFRAEESPARRERKEFTRNGRGSTKSREVYDWLPIHKLTEKEVWADIRFSGVPYHPAYDLGMPRLSCPMCVFAPRAALMIAGKANPELLDRYVKVEKEIGHTFQNKKPISSIRDAILAGEEVGDSELTGAWDM
jgi:3'-phosphoadenosine 5'-phosphosulfate sulfotransferase (PAPS reductase)/FAD synthetase